jgi:transposase
MWKPEHRIAADRSGLRYPSDLTGAEWAVVEPMIPPAKHGGRKRTTPLHRDPEYWQDGPLRSAKGRAR